MKNIETTLRDRIETLASAMGYEFVGCEIQGGAKRSILRIYIDKEKGVTLADCSLVSHQVSAMLDVEEPIQGRYSLEVSSPGLDRPLFKITHYQKQIGNRVKLRVYVPIHNQRKFEGVLLRVDGNNIHLLVDAEEMVLPFSEIERANVIADIR